MNNTDNQYLQLLNEAITKGQYKQNRTGIAAFSLFDYNMKFDLTEGFPILTTKKVTLRIIFEELMLFLRGQTNTKTLENKGVNIWKGNTSREFLDSRGLNYLPEGELGCGYSHQFRNFGGEHKLIPDTKGLQGVDQLQEAFNMLKNNPDERRIIINLWNPNQLQYMALPPCHLYIQFYANTVKKELSLKLVQRSGDIFLGVPFNICQYSLLLSFFAKALNYTPKYFGYTIVDAHLYSNHLEGAIEQISRSSFELPNLLIKKDLETLDDILNLEYTDLELQNYQSHKTIKGVMAV